MTETLYPHEVIVKYWNTNNIRMISAFLFILVGISICLFIENPVMWWYPIGVLICAIMLNNYDYKSRGI